MAVLVMAIKTPDVFLGGQRNQTVYVVLTFGLLPLFNALFDFACAGLTRYLLRMGLDQKRAAWRAVLDGLGGIAISLPWDLRSSPTSLLLPLRMGCRYGI